MFAAAHTCPHHRLDHPPSLDVTFGLDRYTAAHRHNDHSTARNRPDVLDCRPFGNLGNSSTDRHRRSQHHHSHHRNLDDRLDTDRLDTDRPNTDRLDTDRLDTDRPDIAHSRTMCARLAAADSASQTPAAENAASLAAAAAALAIRTAGPVGFDADCPNWTDLDTAACRNFCRSGGACRRNSIDLARWTTGCSN